MPNHRVTAFVASADLSRVVGRQTCANLNPETRNPEDVLARWDSWGRVAVAERMRTCLLALAPAVAALSIKSPIGTPFSVGAAGPTWTGPTGTSFLPEETLERAKDGNPIEKAKLAKDATAAFNDVYEFAAAIREGSLDWKDIEKARFPPRPRPRRAAPPTCTRSRRRRGN